VVADPRLRRRGHWDRHNDNDDDHDNNNSDNDNNNNENTGAVNDCAFFS
jgi:hypothetical protein